MRNEVQPWKNRQDNSSESGPNMVVSNFYTLYKSFFDFRSARYSVSDIPEDPNQRTAAMSSSRKRAESHQPQTLTPPYAQRSSDEGQLSQQAVISAYLRSSYSDDDTGRPRRFSSAEHYYSPSPAHHNSQGQIRRISGNFNAPTDMELERQKDFKKSSRGLGKLKNAVRGLVRV